MSISKRTQNLFNQYQANLGDAALINLIDTLPDSALKTIADQTSKPVIHLAILKHANNSGNADLKKAIIERFPLPVNDIKSAAASEKECLEVLFRAPRITGINMPNSLAIGHRVTDPNRVLAE